MSPASDLFGRKGRRFLESLTLPQGETIILQSALGLIDALDKELKALEGELCARAKTIPEVQLLLGIPGLDVVSIMTILHDVGDIKRFSSPKKLASYAGLVPRVYASGKRHYTGHITRAGRSTLRWILVQAAHGAVRVPGPLQAFFSRLRTRKGYKVAIVAVARKLLTLIWILLTRGEPYRAADSLRMQAKKRRMERRAVPYLAAQASDLASRGRCLALDVLMLPLGAEERACAFS